MTDHMAMIWKTQELENKQHEIVTTGECQWHICIVSGFFFEDDDGSKTAQAICDMHNAALKGGAQ